MDKYQKALDYVNKSVCTALSCLGVNDTKTKESLHTLQELVDEYSIVRSNANLESENKKLKKVLKLLKEKGLGVEVLTEKLKTGERFEHFHITFQCNCLETITREEYELLDEVLNGK